MITMFHIKSVTKTTTPLPPPPLPGWKWSFLRDIISGSSLEGAVRKGNVQRKEWYPIVNPKTLRRLAYNTFCSGIQTFPNDWCFFLQIAGKTHTYVFPVHKKGWKRTVSNYREIAAKSSTSKLFELIVLETLCQIYSHCISLKQHGFMPKRSTATNLTIFHLLWYARWKIGIQLTLAILMYHLTKLIINLHWRNLTGSTSIIRWSLGSVRTWSAEICPLRSLTPFRRPLPSHPVFPKAVTSGIFFSCSTCMMWITFWNALNYRTLMISSSTL